jgi:hypothetical protein
MAGAIVRVGRRGDGLAANAVEHLMGGDIAQTCLLHMILKVSGARDLLHHVDGRSIVGAGRTMECVHDGTAHQARGFGFFIGDDVGRHLVSFLFLGLEVLIGMGLKPAASFLAWMIRQIST